ncbi:MAG: aspartate/glutamate racemase family protein [Alphaproteobacteria bacterium]|nr:aspartate/glutamate racemase family protein [Alphaproteobacteria bacterium]NNF24605.1 aspartate/glutamate racemase family protein [Paracoccaceae bacterium]
MHIGLIGGIGPAATLSYYSKLTTRARQGGAALDLTIVHAEIATLVANLRADRRDAQARVYAPLIQRLAAAGADAIAITSIGGSFCEEETRAISPLPLISAPGAVDSYAAAEGLGTIGLLGTVSAMQSRLFGHLKQTAALVPEDDFDAVGQAYLETAMTGDCPAGRREFFFQAGRAMIARGAEAIVLAGTDLGVAFEGHDPGYRVIDAVDAHVDMLYRLATGASELDTDAI